MEKKKDIELRSGKVRSIIGKMPGYYLRYGTITIIAVLAVLTVTLSSIKSETRITLGIKLLTSPHPYIYFSQDSLSVRHLLPSGSTVAKGDTLCIIEDNPISTPIHGILEQYTVGGRTSPGELILTVHPDTILFSAIVAEIPSNFPLPLHPGDTLGLLFDSGKTDIYAIVSKVCCSKNTEPAPIFTLLLTPVLSSSLSDIRNPFSAEISMGKQSILSKMRNPIH